MISNYSFKNLNNKMKRDDFRISELEKIAGAMGYKVVVKIVDEESGEEI